VNVTDQTVMFNGRYHFRVNVLLCNLAVVAIATQVLFLIITLGAFTERILFP